MIIKNGLICSICLKSIKQTNKAVTACNHIFHFTCLVKNLKYNYNTGDSCPLCRKQYLITTRYYSPENLPNINLRRTGVSVRHAPLLWVSQMPNRNRIIQHARRLNQRWRRPNQSNRDAQLEEEERINKYINELSFLELKNKLKEKGISARGYLRTSLENRLYNSMRMQ